MASDSIVVDGFADPGCALKRLVLEHEVVRVLDPEKNLELNDADLWMSKAPAIDLKTVFPRFENQSGQFLNLRG